MAKDMLRSLDWLCNESTYKDKVDCTGTGVVGFSMGAHNTHLAGSDAYSWSYAPSGANFSSVNVKAAVSLHNGALTDWSGGTVTATKTNHLWTGGTNDS